MSLDLSDAATNIRVSNLAEVDIDITADNMGLTGLAKEMNGLKLSLNKSSKEAAISHQYTRGTANLSYSNADIHVHLVDSAIH